MTDAQKAMAINRWFEQYMAKRIAAKRRREQLIKEHGPMINRWFAAYVATRGLPGNGPGSPATGIAS